MTQISEYFYNTFPNELRQIAKTVDNSVLQEIYGGLSLVNWENGNISFAQDMNKIPVENRGLFVVSLFMIVLADQALHAYFPSEYGLWNKNTKFPKFGYSGFGLHNKSPFDIFVKAESDKDVLVKVNDLMPDFAKFIVDETKKYFDELFGTNFDLQKYFRLVTADSAYKDYTGDVVFKKYFEQYLKESGLI